MHCDTYDWTGAIDCDGDCTGCVLVDASTRRIIEKVK
jgi:hypothetical protein